MKRKKRTFVNVFDISFVLVIAAVIVLTAVFVSPSGRTVTVDYTLTVEEGDIAALSEGDLLNVISGGSIGSVAAVKDGKIEASASAELHMGRYYCGASPLKEGGEYVICVGTNRLVCKIDTVTKR